MTDTSNALLTLNHLIRRFDFVSDVTAAIPRKRSRLHRHSSLYKPVKCEELSRAHLRERVETQPSLFEALIVKRPLQPARASCDLDSKRPRLTQLSGLSQSNMVP